MAINNKALTQPPWPLFSSSHITRMPQSSQTKNYNGEIREELSKSQTIYNLAHDDVFSLIIKERIDTLASNYLFIIYFHA